MSVRLGTWVRFLRTPKGESYGTLVRQLWRSLRADGPRVTWRRMTDFVQAVSDSARTPVPPPDTHKLCLFVSGCPGAVRRYRCEHQAEQLALAGYTSDIVDYPAAPLRDLLSRYRCFVLQRVPFDDHVAAFVREALRQGRQVLFDTDDLVFDESYVAYLDRFDGADPDARAYRERYFERIRQSLALAPHVLATTAALGEAVEQRFPGKRVHLSPNVASREIVALSREARRVTQESRRPTLGYFSGSPTHQDDLDSIVPALCEVLAAEPEVELLLAGEIERPVELAGFGDRVRTAPSVPWRRLPALLRRADIHLAPLADQPFNAAKSEIKYTEAALVERPVVAADVGAFRACIVDGENGFRCATTEQWVAAISRLVHDARLRERIGRAACAEAEAARTTACGRFVDALRAALAQPQAPPSIAVLGEGTGDVRAELREEFPISAVGPDGEAPPCDVALWTGAGAVPEVVARRSRRVLEVGTEVGRVAEEVRTSLR